MPLWKKVHFQLSILLYPLPQNATKWNKRCNTTRYFVGINLSCFKGWTYLSYSWNMHIKLFSNIQQYFRSFSQLLNKNSIYQPKTGEQIFFNLSFTLKNINNSSTKITYSTQFPILYWRFKSYTIVCKYCQYLVT